MNGQWEQKRDVLACLQRAAEYAGKDLSFILTEDESEVEVTNLRSYAFTDPRPLRLHFRSMMAPYFCHFHLHQPPFNPF